METVAEFPQNVGILIRLFFFGVGGAGGVFFKTEKTEMQVRALFSRQPIELNEAVAAGANGNTAFS